MNKIYFLNESVTNYDEYYDEGATFTAAYVASSALAGIIGYVAGTIIGNALKKKAFISDYEKSDIRIRTALSVLKYGLENIYTPVIKSINNASIDTDANGNDFISNPSNIIKTIYKVYDIKSLSSTNEISEKLVLSEDVVNVIINKVKIENSAINSKDDLANALKGKYKEDFIDIYNQYILAIKGLNCTALYNCKSGLSKLKLYINKDIDNYELYNSLISAFINNLYKTASDIVTIAGNNYIYLIGNKTSSTLTKTFNNKLYTATRASKSM